MNKKGRRWKWGEREKEPDMLDTTVHSVAIDLASYYY